MAQFSDGFEDPILEELHNAVLNIVHEDVSMVGEPVDSTTRLVRAFNAFAAEGDEPQIDLDGIIRALEEERPTRRG